MYYPVSSILIEYLILSMLERQDSYGYEISQTIKIATDIKESSLYPILKKLQTQAFVTTYSQEYQGRNRKYYALTELGRSHIDFLQSEWTIYKNTIDDIIEGRLRK